jgi:NitT/TauT family transport system substrate-binding protein
MRIRTAAALLSLSVLAFSACGSDDSSSDDTTADTATTPVDTDGPTDTTADTEPTTGTPTEVVSGEPFPEERCAQNEAAGTITYLTGFDFAAAASIIDVIVADDQGYYDELCLDVEILPSFSTANYPLIAENQAQFSSGGSFSEVVAFADANDAEFVIMAVDGRTAIDGLIVKPGEAAALEDLEGTTIGVKGKLPASIEVMLSGAGLTEGENYDTVLLDGFDPTAHIAIDAIVGFPGWKSDRSRGLHAGHDARPEHRDRRS